MRAGHAVTGLKGGLRNVENVLRLARLFAAGPALEPADLKAAVVDLKLVAEGA